NDYYQIAGTKVLCGLEIDVQDTGHFRVVGSRADILAVAHFLLPYHDVARFSAVDVLLTLFATVNVVHVGAHPLRTSTPWHHLAPPVSKQFDAYDLNGRDRLTDRLRMEERVQPLAEEYKIPVVGGSDTHQQFQYGSVFNVFPECDTIAELKEAIR